MKSLSRIQSAVERVFGVGLGGLLIKQNKRIFVDARAAFCLLAERNGYDRADITVHLSLFDRTTVYNMAQRAEELFLYNKEFYEKVKKAERELNPELNGSAEDVLIEAIEKFISAGEEFIQMLKKTKAGAV